MKKRYLYFLPAGIAVVLLTGLFYNRPAADTAMPAAAGTEGQGISEEAIETETIAAQSEHETSETENEPIAAEESKTSDIENAEETIESSSREEENESETAAEENSKTTLVYGQKEETPFRAAADSYERVDPDWMEPVSGLEGEEDLERYASEIFYDIVCHPDKIEEYSKILTQRTFDMFGYVQWVYVDPEYVYGMVKTECNEGTDYLEGAAYFTPDWNFREYEELIMDKRIEGELNEKYPGAAWQVVIRYDYEKDTGLISTYMISQPITLKCNDRFDKKITCKRCAREADS